MTKFKNLGTGTKWEIWALHQTRQIKYWAVYYSTARSTKGILNNNFLFTISAQSTRNLIVSRVQCVAFYGGTYLSSKILQEPRTNLHIHGSFRQTEAALWKRKLGYPFQHRFFNIRTVIELWGYQKFLSKYYFCMLPRKFTEYLFKKLTLDVQKRFLIGDVNFTKNVVTILDSLLFFQFKLTWYQKTTRKVFFFNKEKKNFGLHMILLTLLSF